MGDPFLRGSNFLPEGFNFETEHPLTKAEAGKEIIPVHAGLLDLITVAARTGGSLAKVRYRNLYRSKNHPVGRRVPGLHHGSVPIGRADGDLGQVFPFCHLLFRLLRLNLEVEQPGFVPALERRDLREYLIR